MKKEFGVSYFDSKGVKHWLVLRIVLVSPRARPSSSAKALLKRAILLPLN